MGQLHSIVRSALQSGRISLNVRPLSAIFRVEVEGDIEVEGRVWVPGFGQVHIGRRVRLLGRRAPIELNAHRGGHIWIDEGSVIEAGASIEATLSVRIGPGAHVGSFCKIIDNNFHQTSGDRTKRPDAIPIAIGREAHVGPRAILLPGAALGAGARVGAGRVLSFRLPAHGVA